MQSQVLTVLCEFGGADLSSDVEGVPGTEEVSVDYVWSGGLVDAGERRVLVGTASCLFVLEWETDMG